MRALRTRCQAVVKTAREAFGGVEFPENTPVIYDEVFAAQITREELKERLLLPPDGPHLHTLTLPNEAYDGYMREILGLEAKKRKNWKGYTNVKNVRMTLVWHPGYQRIHTKNNAYYVVRRAVWDSAMSGLGRGNELRIATTMTGMATAMEGLSVGNTSSCPSARAVMREEDRTLRTGNHGPRKHVAAPLSGTRPLKK